MKELDKYRGTEWQVMDPDSYFVDKVVNDRYVLQGSLLNSQLGRNLQHESDRLMYSIRKVTLATLGQMDWNRGMNCFGNR